jgi:hypothetical protein
MDIAKNSGTYKIVVFHYIFPKSIAMITAFASKTLLRVNFGNRRYVHTL